MKLTPRILERLEPIRELSPRRLVEMVDLCKVESHALGSDPIRDISRLEFVYLLAGELKIVLPDGSSRLLVGGCDIANWPIGYKTVVPVSSKAVTDVVLLRVEFDILDVMMTWDQLTTFVDFHPDGEVPEAAVAHTVLGTFSVQVLTSGALAQLPSAHIHELLKRFVRVRVNSGQVIIKAGEPASDYFLVESGRCEVRKIIGGVDLCVAELKAGDAFGEEALIAETIRNASIVMKKDGTLLRLAKPDFVELLQTPLLHAIDRPEAERRVASGVAVWLDIRYPAEFAEDGLPGAINLPLNEIRSAFGLLDKQREYVVYCQSGRRSAAGAFLLAQHGFNAFLLHGGLGGSEKT
ncbi:MAG: rhodanese-like protein,cyclic nucleotide-binding protein [Proteobacteria bacterium]|nr:rhodanese-like protein,cyclic nucleotide-binding protein [Pseudomonadota bacterium]